MSNYQTLNQVNPLFGKPQSVNPYYTRTQNDLEMFQGQSMNNVNPFVGQPQSVNPYYTRTPDMQSMNNVNPFVGQPQTVNPYYTRTPDMQSMNNANPFVGQPQTVNPNYINPTIEKITSSYTFLFKKPKYPKHKNRKYSYSKLKL